MTINQDLIMHNILSKNLLKLYDIFALSVMST